MKLYRQSKTPSLFFLSSTFPLFSLLFSLFFLSSSFWVGFFRDAPCPSDQWCSPHNDNVHGCCGSIHVKSVVLSVWRWSDPLWARVGYSVCPSVRLYICPSVCLPVYLSVLLSVCPPFIRLFFRPSVVSAFALGLTMRQLWKECGLFCRRLPHLPSLATNYRKIVLKQDPAGQLCVRMALKRHKGIKKA